MSADEPLVKRIEGMLERARDTRETLQFQVEDAAHKLAQLEMAQRVAQVKAYIEDEANVPFEMEFRVMGREKLIIVCAGGTSAMATMRMFIVALLDKHAKELAEL